MNDKATLQAHLNRLTQDWTSLQAAVAQRQQEIAQMEARKATLTEEILRNQGALAYNQMLAEAAKNALAVLESTPVPSV